MSIQAPEKTDNATAIRIRRIRETFSAARTKAGLKDPEVLCSGFEERVEVIP